MSDAVQINSNFYVAGGTMLPDAPSYIRRKADNELYERTLAGDFCYVLTPRQMGKSSLMARTAYRLKKQGIQTVIIDLTQIGSERGKESAGQWYCGIADRVIEELGIVMDIGKWWEERKHLTALQRLTKFFSDIVLANPDQQVVIFVDEIDTTITLPFTDDFFAAIRARYNARATQPIYRRLSFVFLGVATPSQLIKDTGRTPFNIGHRIELTDFTPEEALPLANGLGKDQRRGEEALERILYWTGGHPYLTQKLCHIAVDEKSDVYSDEYIDGLVEKCFLAPAASRRDPNLNFVRDRLVHEKKRRRRFFLHYRSILQGHPIIDEPLSFIHTALKLSGLVVPRENQQLSVRNRIYEQVFTTHWVKKVIPTDWKRNITIASIAVILLVLVIVFWAILPLQYIETIRTARDDAPIPAYKKLQKTPGFANKANDLFAEYWDRRALRNEAGQKRDEAVLYRLRAMKVKDTEIRRREIGSLVKDDYENLIATYRHNDRVNAVAFSPDGRTILTGSDDKTARLWRTDTGKPVGKPLIHDDKVLAVAFSPDGCTVLTGSNDKTARLWRADTGESMGKIMKHTNWVRAVSFSPDGRTVLTGSFDRTARLWRADTGKPVGKIMKHKSWVNAVSFSPDGRTVLTGSSDRTARLWRADSGKPVGKIIRHGSRIYAVSFSPDGNTVLAGSDDKTTRLWRVDTGEPVGKSMKHKRGVDAVAFSPNGRTVLTGSLDGTARLWRADTGKPVGKIMKHTDWVKVVVFSPDGSTVLTGSFDGTARLWRADTGEPVGKPMIHNAVAFSPNGRTVLTGSFDGTARLWRADTGEAEGKIIRHDPIEGDPAQLLEEWQKKLSLKLDEKTGKIEPMYPLP
jgi:WD40 repeat protein